MSKEWIASSDVFLAANSMYAMITTYKCLSYIMNCENGKIFAARINENCNGLTRLTDDEILCMGCDYVCPLIYADGIDEEDYNDNENAKFIPYCGKHQCRCEYMNTSKCKENDDLTRNFFVEFCKD